jgi:kumamolisin
MALGKLVLTRPRPAIGVACGLIAAVIAGCTGAWFATASDRVAGDRLIGPTPAARPIDALLVFRLRERRLESYLRQLNQHGSRLYQHYGTAASFGADFGISDAGLRQVERFVRAAGWQVVAAYPQRTVLRIQGTAASVKRTFRVTMEDFRTRDGVTYHAPAARPRIPRSLAPWVVGVADLNTKPRPVPLDVPSRVPSALLGAAALAPGDAAAAYDVTPLYRAGVAGQGQTIAVVSFDKFVDADVRLFDRMYHYTASLPQHVPVDGGTTVGDGHGESDLDVELVREIAPQATILSYEAPGDASWADVFNAIFAGNATIVTNSWGICETVIQSDSPDDRAATEQALQMAAFKGVTVFSASGDAGAYDCQRSDLSSRTATVEFPSDSPWDLSVGGTVLSVRTDGSYLREVAWGDPLSNGGGGGGFNPVESEPVWQRPVVTGDSTKRRALPDVAAAAAIGSPWAVVIDNQLTPVWGTSAAAPFWAASMLLVNQYMQRQGAGPLCFAPTLLYHVAALHRAPPPFHDVTLGSNRYYPAARGWDAATGLGSPDVWNLARDAVAYRKANPLPSSGNACRNSTS